MVSGFPASRIYDGGVNGNLHARPTWAAGGYVSMQVAGTRIIRVDVYNRGGRNAGLLGAFQVWVGSSAPSSYDAITTNAATQCGGDVTNANTPGPFPVNCGGVILGSWVTIKRVPLGALTISEVQVFGS